jgi:hypothetical protein
MEHVFMNKTTSQKIMLLMYNKQYNYTLSVSLIPLLLIPSIVQQSILHIFSQRQALIHLSDMFLSQASFRKQTTI